MTYGLEIHDTRLLALRRDTDGRGYALLHTFVYRGAGRLFETDMYECGWQDARLDFEGMSVEGEVDLSKEPYASDGCLQIGEQVEENIVYLPADHTGKICLEMCLSPEFDTLKIHASKMTSTLLGEFQLEAIWNTDGTHTSVR
jgi:hypothetical protein